MLDQGSAIESTSVMSSTLFYSAIFFFNKIKHQSVKMIGCFPAACPLRIPPFALAAFTNVTPDF